MIPRETPCIMTVVKQRERVVIYILYIYVSVGFNSESHGALEVRAGIVAWKVIS